MQSKLAITTTSLGLCSSGHSLASKLEALYRHGYHGVEIYSDDLYDLAKEYQQGVEQELDPTAEALISAARKTFSLCQDRQIEVISLQPFRNYEGLVDRKEHASRLDELQLWLSLAHELHTDLILVPSTMAADSMVSTDFDLIVADLQEAADLAASAQPPIRLCYESLCWGTRCDVWEKSWEVVCRVGRANFGLCLDTFNIAGRVFADPTLVGGIAAGDPSKDITDSMTRLLMEVDVNRVFLVQVVDAMRLDSPLCPEHPYFNASQPSRMSWSRNCRVFYGEEAGYLPIREISTAIFRGLGYSGWVSMELFNRQTADTGSHVAEEMAKRGAESWLKLVSDMSLYALPLQRARNLVGIVPSSPVN